MKSRNWLRSSKQKKIKMLITEQVIDEHARNRDREVAESVKRIDQIPTSAQIPRFAEHHESTKKLFDAIKYIKSAKTELVESVMAELKGGGLRADKLINELFALSPTLKRTPETYNRARIRRELGNPPGKKESLGDQINWEILLSSVPEKNRLASN